MARFFQTYILILAALFIAGQSKAQESLRTLSGMQREQVLDWANPELTFDFKIPPNSTAATLTLYGEPGKVRPVSGSMMVVSLNDQAGIVVAPRPESFSASISFPASHLQAGENQIRITFEGENGASCLKKADGAWYIDLARSRFDLSVSPGISSFAVLEDWLSAGPWALSKISIEQGDLGQNTYAAMGALVSQGLALRAGRVPQIVVAGPRAELSFQARIDPAFTGPLIALRPGVRPVVEFQGRNEDDILAAVRLFTSRIIRLDGTRAAPARLAQAPLVRSSSALDGLETALSKPVWNARPYTNTVRTPHGGQTRLVIDMARPDWVSPNSTALISIDGEKPFKKRLKDSLNHFVIPLSKNSATVVRSFSISHQTGPVGEDAHCPAHQSEAPVQVLDARIETTGFEVAHGLARFAVDGAPFSTDFGSGAAIVFATRTDAQLRASWRAVGRIALVGGVPLNAAWYGTTAQLAPKEKALIVLGPRNQLAPYLVAGMPGSFALNAAAGPKDYEHQRKKRSFSVSRAAFAADTSTPLGLGVAGWVQGSEAPILVLTGDRVADFVPAMNALADGPAMNFFSGLVVRWRAGLVEINDIGLSASTAPSSPPPLTLLFFIAGICLIGLWLLVWRRMYLNWRPA